MTKSRGIGRGGRRQGSGRPVLKPAELIDFGKLPESDAEAFAELSRLLAPAGMSLYALRHLMSMASSGGVCGKGAIVEILKLQAEWSPTPRPQVTVRIVAGGEADADQQDED